MGASFLDGIARLKAAESDGELQVHGSIRLARTLHEAGLVDICRFLVAPVVVGGGARIFESDGPAHSFEVRHGTVTRNGVFSVEMTRRNFDNSLRAAVDEGRDVITEN